MTWLQLKSLVIDLLSDMAPASSSNALYVEAVAAFVKNRAIKEMAGDNVLAKSHENTFRELRRKLAGRASTASAPAFNAAVRARLSDLTDASPTDDLAGRACADYVKALIALHVQQDQTLYKALMDSWNSYRIRMLGRTFTINLTTLRATVRTYLTVDALRLNIQTFIDAQCARAKQELEAMSAYVDQLITSGRENLEAVQTRVQAEILNCVVDLQTFIDALKSNHRTLFTAADVVVDGFASRGKLPAGARPQSAWILYPASADSTHCGLVPCTPIPAHRLNDRMLCWNTCEAQISFGPGSVFYVTPKLVTDEIEFRIIWDGIKESYADNEEVVYDRTAAQAIAEWIKAKLAEEDSDVTAFKLAWASYVQFRKITWRNAQEVRELVPVDDIA